MSRFLEAIHSGRVLVMDGAMGTELMRAGARWQDGLEVWNLTRPDAVRAVHRSYVAAGAEVFLTHTFQVHPAHLAKFGRMHEAQAIVRAAVALARDATGPDRFVLGDFGPWPDPKPEQVTPIVEAMAGMDSILVETASDTELLSVIVHSLADLGWSSLPVLFSATFLKKDGAYLSPQHTPTDLARCAAELGVAALGINCGRDLDLEDMAFILERYRATTQLPLFVRPNAGTPVETADGLVFPRTARGMAEKLNMVLDRGVRMIGGCCGTTPEYIAGFARTVAKYTRK